MREEPQICGIVYRVILLSTSLRSKQAETTKELPQAGNRIFSRLGSFLFHTEPDEYEWSPPEAWQGIVAACHYSPAGMCDLVAELRPKVSSFHFGLPVPKLVDRLKGAGCLIFASATTVAEAQGLEARGADAVIAQGVEAGGHRGILTDAVESQVGTFALVPQVADAVSVPVIAAGGIGDARGIVAAFVLGAADAQLGTAFLFCPEARISAPYRDALRSARYEDTALTNVFAGRPARGLKNRVMQEVGPLSPIAPPFPLAATALYQRPMILTHGIPLSSKS